LSFFFSAAVPARLMRSKCSNSPGSGGGVVGLEKLFFAAAVSGLGFEAGAATAADVDAVFEVEEAAAAGTADVDAVEVTDVG
jgi:hypothetical protein